MEINKNISVWRGSNTPPTNYHLWIKDDNSIYLHNGVDWVRSNQSYQIVNSIEELDENAEQGSLAVVAKKTVDETTLYIKESQGWKEFKTGSEVVNNLEDGGEDKALSAAMGKYLKQLIDGAVSGDSVESVKFKGYVNVDNKNGIDNMFNHLREGEACLVAPSANTDSGDSYKAWIASAINKEELLIGEELFKTSHNITVQNVLSGANLEVKTYLKLDEAQPFCQCPDMILLCKIKVKAKDFVEFVDGISPTIASIIPDSLMLTACIGKVLRWSGGDWVAENQSLLERGIVKNYPYRYDINSAIQTGVISYTDNQGYSGDSIIGVGGWYTVFVNASADVDSGGVYAVSQTAYGRNGEAANRVFTRLLFVKNGAISDKTPWVEITKNTNILPNVNGWLLNSSELLATGVYQTCNTRYTKYTTVVDSEGKEQIVGENVPIGDLRNNYCSLFVNASTTPNADGWDAIEQTAYGREVDEGKIYRRVIFNNRSTGETQYKEWRRIDEGGSVSSEDFEEWWLDLAESIINTFASKDELPTKTSQLTNDSGYINSIALSSSLTGDNAEAIKTSTIVLGSGLYVDQRENMPPRLHLSIYSPDFWLDTDESGVMGGKLRLATSIKKIVSQSKGTTIKTDTDASLSSLKLGTDFWNQNDANNGQLVPRLKLTTSTDPNHTIDVGTIVIPPQYLSSNGNTYMLNITGSSSGESTFIGTSETSRLSTLIIDKRYFLVDDKTLKPNFVIGTNRDVPFGGGQISTLIIPKENLTTNENNVYTLSLSGGSGTKMYCDVTSNGALDTIILKNNIWQLEGGQYLRPKIVISTSHDSTLIVSTIIIPDNMLSDAGRGYCKLEAITASEAEGEQVTDYVLMASDVKKELGDSDNPISQGAVKAAIESIEDMIVTTLNTPI